MAVVDCPSLPCPRGPWVAHEEAGSRPSAGGNHLVVGGSPLLGDGALASGTDPGEALGTSWGSVPGASWEGAWEACLGVACQVGSGA